MTNDWRTDKRLVTFSFVKKYCPYRIYDKHSMSSRCPKIERTPKAKLYPLCARKDCFIWNGLEKIEEDNPDNILLEKIERLIT